MAKKNESTQPNEPTDMPQSAQSATDETAPEGLAGEQAALDALADAMRSASSESDDEQTQRIAELEAEIEKLKEQLMRSAAEAENIRRRAEREQQETTKYAKTSFARDLISVYENLMRASTSISDEARQQDQQLGNLATGVDMTLNELAQAFSKNNIQRIDPTGQPFDHNLHQAMNKVETSEYPEGSVVHVLQAAYTIHDRLLQPALVTVATKPAGDTASGQGESNDSDAHNVDTQA